MKKLTKDRIDTFMDLDDFPMSEITVLHSIAEECSELAHAALKMARVLSEDNITPVTRPEARESLIEEMADLNVMTYMFRKMDVIGDEHIEYIEDLKTLRMLSRNNKLVEVDDILNNAK